MGSKPSKHRAKGDSVVMIVLAGGKKETYSRPVSAQEIMLRHPQHVLTHLDVKDADFMQSIVTPESVLLPGMKYFLVPRHAVQWLLAHHSDLKRTCGNITGGTKDPSDHDNGIDHSVDLVDCGLHDVLQLPPKDSVIAPPQHSTEEQGYQEKLGIGRVKLPKSPRNITCSDNQWPWRSSPKVCPGDQYSLWDERLSDSSPSSLCKSGAVKEYDHKLFASPQEDQQLKPIEEKRRTIYHVSELPHDSSELLKSPTHVHSPDILLQPSMLLKDQTCGGLEEKVGLQARCSTSLHGCASIHLKTSPPGEGVALYQSNHVLSHTQAEICLHGHSIFSGEEPQKRSLLELLNCPDLYILKPVVDEWQCSSTLAQAVDTRSNGTSKIHVVEVPFMEPLKSNDFCAEFMFHNRAKAHALSLNAEVNEVITANKQQPSSVPFVDSVEHQICVTASHTVAFSTTPCLHQEDARHGDFEEHLSRTIIDLEGLEEVSVGEYHNAVQLYGKAEDSKGNIISEAPQVRELDIDASMCNNEAGSAFQPRDQGDNPTELCLTLSDDVRGDEERDGFGSQDHCSAYTANVSILPIVTICTEAGASCSLEDQEMALTVCPNRQAMDVDCSDAEKLSKELNFQRGRTLGDIFLQRSPDYLGLINAGRRIDGMPPLLTSSPPPSSSSSMGASLSVLMKIDAPNIKRSDPFNFAVNWQENLALLGFQSIGSDSLSIYGQARAHTRANLLVMGEPPLGTFIKPSLETVQRKGSQHLFHQQENAIRKEAWRPSTSTPQRFPRSFRRGLIWKPRREPLSPIIEVSPEQSPASLSPLSKGS